MELFYSWLCDLLCSPLQSYGNSVVFTRKRGGNLFSSHFTLIFSLLLLKSPPIFHLLGWKICLECSFVATILKAKHARGVRKGEFDKNFFAVPKSRYCPDVIPVSRFTLENVQTSWAFYSLNQHLFPTLNIQPSLWIDKSPSAEVIHGFVFLRALKNFFMQKSTESTAIGV